jgi:ribosomal-protein-alanine N-acetyltransferase
MKCNRCGRELKVENGILKEDCLQIKKEWGYFSRRDLEIDEFCICEGCYEDLINGFQIPIDKTDKTEAV